MKIDLRIRPELAQLLNSHLPILIIFVTIAYLKYIEIMLWKVFDGINIVLMIQDCTVNINT